MIYLEFARRNKGWSQKTLGDLPTVRVHQAFISQIEIGTGVPTPEQAERLAKALDLTPDILLQPVNVVMPEGSAVNG